MIKELFWIWNKNECPFFYTKLTGSWHSFLDGGSNSHWCFSHMDYDNKTSFPPSCIDIWSSFDVWSLTLHFDHVQNVFFHVQIMCIYLYWMDILMVFATGFIMRKICVHYVETMYKCLYWIYKIVRNIKRFQVFLWARISNCQK